MINIQVDTLGKNQQKDEEQKQLDSLLLSTEEPKSELGLARKKRPTAIQIGSLGNTTSN